MGQRPPSSDSSSSSSEEEEEEEAASPPPAKKPTLNSTSPKSKPSKPLKPPSPDEEEDKDGEPPVYHKKDQKKVKKNEEEEEGSSDDESSSDDEEEKQQEEEEEEDGEEGSGTSDDEKQKLLKKPAPAAIVTPATSGMKRRWDSAPSELENTQRKKPFKRIWEADDEIKILKGITDFYSDKGRELPSNTGFGADLNAIHSLLKKSLGLEFSKTQLGTKIRGLKRKFLTNASRFKNNKDPNFSEPQQQKIYELSKQIWLPENPNEACKSSGKSVKSKGMSSAFKVLKDQEEADIPERYEFLWKAIAQAGHGDFSPSLIKRGLKLVDPEKASSLEKRLRELELRRMRHRLQWLDKREKATKMIIDSIAKSG